jgi:cardiolipin synthase
MLRLVFIPFIAMSVLDHRYGWALGILILAGLTDALDGLLARWLQQKTVLGQYLDPIADKLLLSTMFVVLSLVHRIPWDVTILVFSRDIAILLVSALLYATTNLRDFSPSIFGKLNTLAQIITVLLVLLHEVTEAVWVFYAVRIGFWTVAAFTIFSGVHYVSVIGQRLRNAGSGRQAAA